MKGIDVACIGKWVLSSNQQYSSPASIATNCPHCLRQVVFATRRRQYDAYRDTLSCSGDCPACGVEAHFWICDISTHDDATRSGDDDRPTPTLFMMPGGPAHLDLSEIRDRIPESLAHYCDSVLDVYKSGNLTATNILMRATLESLFSSLLPIGNSRTGLSKLIQDTCKSVDLAEPINRLANSVARDGSLGTLFDNDEHTTRESADAMIDLLGQLLLFLFVLPAEFEDLEERFAALCHSQERLDGDSDGKPGYRLAS